MDQRSVDADMESARRLAGDEAVNALEEGRAWDVQTAVEAALH